MNRFIILDGHAIIYRAYYAFPELTDPQGRLVNAVYGFSRILLTSIRDFEPEYIAVAFDHKAPTKRSEQFEAYKAQRAPMPEDMKPQIEIIKEVVTALNIPQFEIAGFEADDLIGTIVRQVGEARRSSDQPDIVVITGDKDLFQLVDDHVHVFIPGRGKFSTDKEYDAQGVEQKLGVLPSQVVDLKALMGDSSDNIPGVKGIGPKSAAGLIKTFGSLNSVYQAVQAGDERIKGATLQKLTDGKESAYLSQELATIVQDAPLTFELSKCAVREYNKDDVAKLFEQLHFDSLVQLLPKDEFEQGVQAALF